VPLFVSRNLFQAPRVISLVDVRDEPYARCRIEWTNPSSTAHLERFAERAVKEIEDMLAAAKASSRDSDCADYLSSSNRDMADDSGMFLAKHDPSQTGVVAKA
jgi:hypothetical protein